MALNIFGPGFADGVEVLDLGSGTLPSAGTGFKHFSVNLGTLPHAYNVPLLESGRRPIELSTGCLLGFPAERDGDAGSGSRWTMFRSTMTANTNTRARPRNVESSEVPPGLC